jgi:hypothetical protein
MSQDQVTIEMRFAMATTQADGDLCTEEQAEYYIVWLKRNGLTVVETAEIADLRAKLDEAEAQIRALTCT